MLGRNRLAHRRVFCRFQVRHCPGLLHVRNHDARGRVEGRGNIGADAREFPGNDAVPRYMTHIFSLVHRAIL